MVSEMRALSIQPPWIGAIVCSDKRVENRTWPAPDWITGQCIALHASKGPDWDAPAKAWTASGLTPYDGITPRKAWTASLTLGAVMAVAEISGCHHSSNASECPGPKCSPWAAIGQYHWQLANVRPLAEPVPCKGALSLWRLPEDAEKLVRAQLPVNSKHA